MDGFAEGGIAINPAMPFNGLNWGQLYTDRANTPIFNSGVLTAQRPLTPKEETFDYGFKLQGMIGEDVRYNHYMGQLDYLIPSRTQVGLIEAHALMHIPVKSPLTEGGVDIGPMGPLGVPFFGLAQDGTRYFDLHHTANDTLDKIDPAQLNQNVAAWAALVWLIADSDVDFRAMRPADASPAAGH
mgnify:CR=1 FL=1